MNVHAVVYKLDEYVGPEVLEYWSSYDRACEAMQRILDHGFYKSDELSVELIEVFV